MAYRWIVGCAVLLILAAAVVPVSGDAIFIDPGTISLKLDSTQEPVASPAAGGACGGCGSRGSVPLCPAGTRPCRARRYMSLFRRTPMRTISAFRCAMCWFRSPPRLMIYPPFPRVSADGVEDWGVGKKIVGGRNQITYGSDSFYPSSNVRVVEVGRLRTWKVVQIEYWPCQYNPVSGRLRSVKSGRIAD